MSEFKFENIGSDAYRVSYETTMNDIMKRIVAVEEEAYGAGLKRLGWASPEEHQRLRKAIVDQAIRGLNRQRNAEGNRKKLLRLLREERKAHRETQRRGDRWKALQKKTEQRAVTYKAVMTRLARQRPQILMSDITGYRAIDVKGGATMTIGPEYIAQAFRDHGFTVLDDK